MWLLDHLVGREGDMVMCTIWRPHVVRIKVTHGVHMLTKNFTYNFDHGNYQENMMWWRYL